METAGWSPHEAVFQLNSQIPPHSNSSKLATCRRRGGTGRGRPAPRPQGGAVTRSVSVWRRRRGRDGPLSNARTGARSFAGAHSPAPHGLREGPTAWPLEPPHLPKVRGQFADFP